MDMASPPAPLLEMHTLRRAADGRLTRKRAHDDDGGVGGSSAKSRTLSSAPGRRVRLAAADDLRAHVLTGASAVASTFAMAGGGGDLQGRAILAPHLQAADMAAVERKGDVLAHLELCKCVRRRWGQEDSSAPRNATRLR